MRTLIVFLLSLTLGATAMAAELPFKIVGASVEKFERPMQTRTGRYEQALVLRLEADRKAWESLPPSIETFLYIGKHELRPMETELGKDRVVLTFHDPDWQSLKGGESMVLTTEHGDPVTNPESYAGYPRYDPKGIE